jgi:hypothetical protein
MQLPEIKMYKNNGEEALKTRTVRRRKTATKSSIMRKMTLAVTVNTMVRSEDGSWGSTTITELGAVRY